MSGGFGVEDITGPAGKVETTGKFSIMKDSSGRYRTESLFYEISRNNTYEPLFTLKPYDHKGYLSIKRLYLEADDPTEYTFALNVFGSWEHWLKIRSLNWFLPYLLQMREELDTLRTSRYLKKLDILTTKPDTALPATRVLLDKSWERKKAGRPKKQDIDREVEAQAINQRNLDEDSERIGL